MGIFLLFGTAMAALAGLTLVWHGTLLDRIWALNPRAYAELAPLGPAPGFGFLLLGVVMAVTARGWIARRLWGWWITVVTIAAQLVGGVVHLLTGRFAEGSLGFCVPGLLLLYLSRPRIKKEFQRRTV